MKDDAAGDVCQAPPAAGLQAVLQRLLELGRQLVLGELHAERLPGPRWNALATSQDDIYEGLECDAPSGVRSPRHMVTLIKLYSITKGLN